MKKLILVLIPALFLSSLALATDTIKSTSTDQTAMAVTVYNSDLGLVKDLRTINLPAGQAKLEFMDVASQIQPVTVHAQAVDNPTEFRILEQNYEYDLMSQEKILDKYVGKKLKIVQWKDYQDRQDTVEAMLLSSEGQIYQVGDEIYLGYPGYKVVPQIPDNLISKPTLVWLFENDSAAKKSIEVSYLTSGISWKADYVFVVNDTDTATDISGWVTVDNRSGATYNDAKLKLVAGDVNRVQSPMAYAKEGFAGARVMAMDAAPQFQEQGFFEYHLYDLQRKTTIKNNQTKQISLLESSGVNLEKIYEVQGFNGAYTQRYWEPVTKHDVNTFFKFKNAKTNHLGMPLPEGTIRLYKKDKSGSQQFIGEDHIKHTPEDEEVKLTIGKAFDIVAERVQTDYQQITSKVHQTEWEITIRNHKDEDVVVLINEPFSTDWRVLSTTHAPKKLSAWMAQFAVAIPKKGETKLKYRVQVEYK